MRDQLNLAIQTILDALPGVCDADYQDWIVATALTKQDETGILKALHAARREPSLEVLIGGSDASALAVTLDCLASQLWREFSVVISCPQSRLADLHHQMGERWHGAPSCRIVSVDVENDDTLVLEHAALEAAQADYVGFLAPGDRIPTHAIAEIVLALVRNPQTFILFTDEDWVDAAGERSRPRFKAGWDPDAQLGFDLMGRFSPMLREAALSAGGLDRDAGLAAHYALHCRLAGEAGPAGIQHLASVLRHAARQPAASLELAISYTASARIIAETAAQQWEGIIVDARTPALAPFFNRIEWPCPEQAPLVSILMPTRDRADLLEAAAIGVLEKTDYPAIELLVLDNGSIERDTMRLFEKLALDPRVRILPMPGPFNYSKINNDGAAVAQGEILLLLNNDIEIFEPGWLREMVSLVVRLEIGCVGAKLLYSNRCIQHAGINMASRTGCAHVGRLFDCTDPGDSGMLAITRTHSAVTAACLAIRAAVFAEVGGLDEEALKVGYNDVDLCLKVRDYGYRSVCSPFATLFHMESISRGPNDNPEKKARERAENERIAGRWRDIFLDDPYQNPNTLLTWEGRPLLVQSRRQRVWEGPL